ncbi:MAG: DUF2867 domain-containing protein [Anaerolineales bacterium]|nr:DUF2867 domain-containing protein [Anaerolineales bacterium]
MHKPLILVTGATGYVGGRLVPQLLAEGYRVRLLVRDASRLQGRAWLPQVEVVEGDVLNPETLPPALDGVKVAYYLIHSMSGDVGFHQRDLVAARNFGEACKTQSVSRIIYLGGLGDPQADLSQHLQSRHQTGEALIQTGVPITEFRAAVIVGSGSISFEMIRYLTERVPLMICPRWVYTRIQPIAILDVLDYLVAALKTPASTGRIIEIGGSDVLTYGEMMLGYAKIRGLKRVLLPVPVLTPRLSSYWVHWVTPVSASIARPLIEGLRNEVIVRDEQAKQIFPNLKPRNYQTAVELALSDLDASQVETSWSDALVTSSGDVVPLVLSMQEGMILEQRQSLVNTSPAHVYQVISRLGGNYGWLYLNWAWRLRGILDRMVGGVGFRRGRRDIYEVRVGDAVDFWRVEAVEPERLLRLRAEMRVPGSAWLQFELKSHEEGQTRLTQTAFFAPKGLSGLLYWYLLYPVHGLIFSRLIRKIGARAESLNLIRSNQPD